MLMTLGLFVFELSSAPFTERRRQTNWRYPQQGRVGARPARQYLGPGADTIELQGILYPALTGGPLSLEALRTMAATGQAWPLIEGTGQMRGLYVIAGVEETASHLMADGAAQRLGFSLTLERVDDYSLGASAAGLVGGVIGAVGDSFGNLFR